MNIRAVVVDPVEWKANWSLNESMSGGVRIAEYKT